MSARNIMMASAGSSVPISLVSTIGPLPGSGGTPINWTYGISSSANGSRIAVSARSGTTGTSGVGVIVYSSNSGSSWSTTSSLGSDYGIIKSSSDGLRSILVRSVSSLAYQPRYTSDGWVNISNTSDLHVGFFDARFFTGSTFTESFKVYLDNNLQLRRAFADSSNSFTLTATNPGSRENFLGIGVNDYDSGGSASTFYSRLFDFAPPDYTEPAVGIYTWIGQEYLYATFSETNYGPSWRSVAPSGFFVGKSTDDLSSTPKVVSWCHRDTVNDIYRLFYIKRSPGSQEYWNTIDNPLNELSLPSSWFNSSSDASYRPELSQDGRVILYSANANTTDRTGSYFSIDGGSLTRFSPVGFLSDVGTYSTFSTSSGYSGFAFFTESGILHFYALRKDAGTGNTTYIDKYKVTL